MKKILSLMLALCLVFGCVCALASCGEENSEAEQVQVLDEVSLGAKFEVPADFKIGFIFLHDENSTYDLNFINAANNIKSYLGLTDEQVIMEVNVPEEGNDCYDAAIRLVNKGCKIIFADSFGHEDNMIKAAEENPDVQFCHATGTKALVKTNLTNYHNAFASIYEGRFLAGIAAGMKLNEMIEAGDITAEQAIIGYVGAFPYAEVVSGYTSFFLGARSVCASATMKVRYTDSWYDYDKEKAAAKSLIEIDNCVLISQHADSWGAPSLCEEKGVPNVSYNGSTVEA
ncbi:MAG: BMP family ABC transporter substrate-binding protein, partial [Clostridia bacterium]|nr:BMP family ABC transporter substrate-binding protein [Clostridia bacterium]